MKRYSAAAARQNLRKLLDTASAGEVVIIERRSERYRLERERKTSKKRKPRSSPIAKMHVAVAAGQWTWRWSKDGLLFAAKRSR
jgi:hypothetical protein